MYLLVKYFSYYASYVQCSDHSIVPKIMPAWFIWAYFEERVKCLSVLPIFNKKNVYLYLLSHILATFHFNFKW